MDESHGALTPLQAAEEIREVAQWSEKLSGRIEGLTWMFWGVVSAAIFTSYAFAASTSDRVPPWIGILWVPWVTVGLLFTALLWKAAGVVIQRPLASRRELALHACLFFLATVGSVIVALAFHQPIYPPTAVLLGIGTVSTMSGLRRSIRTFWRQGAVQATGGIILITAAVAEAFLLAGRPFLEGVADAALINAFVSAGALMAIGFYRSVTS